LAVLVAWSACRMMAFFTASESMVVVGRKPNGMQLRNHWFQGCCFNLIGKLPSCGACYRR
jgi:hypothetical protein